MLYQCATEMGHLLSVCLRDNQAHIALGLLTYFTQWVAGGVSMEAGIQHHISCSRLPMLSVGCHIQIASFTMSCEALTGE